MRHSRVRRMTLAGAVGMCITAGAAIYSKVRVADAPLPSAATDAMGDFLSEPMGALMLLAPFVFLVFGAPQFALGGSRARQLLIVGVGLVALTAFYFNGF